MTETARRRYCIPEELLQRIDVIARRRGVSRNRMVLASCEIVCSGYISVRGIDAEVITVNLIHFSRITAISARHW